MKLANDIIKHYYLDGSKILGEEWLDENGQNHKIDYFYNAEGIAGIRYDNYNYNFNFVKDRFGNISKVMHRGKLIAEYNYDAWGNCAIQYLGTTPPRDIFVVENNPFRWKSHYCDLETGFYSIPLAGYGIRYYDPEIMQFLDALPPGMIDPTEIRGLNRYGLGVPNPLMSPANCANISPSLPLYFDEPDSNGNRSGWLGWLMSGAMTAIGIGLCFVPGGQIFGAGLIVGGAFGLVANGITAAGVNSQTASMIVSGLNVVAGIGMLFTPLAPLGATMIGSGIGSVAGGYISLSAGGSYGLGAAIGGIVGGIACGYAYQGIQYARAYHFLKVNGSTNPRGDLAAFNGIPLLTKLRADTEVYRAWGDGSGMLGHWISPNNYGTAARSMLALPPWNSALNTYSTVLASGTRVLAGTAAPLFGQVVGGVQWWVALLT